jgi:hypothetical protein
MAKFTLKHPKIDINGTDLENHASSIEISSEYDEVEFTSFCSDFKEYGQGLGDCTWTIDFFQDFAALNVDAVLWPLSQSGGTFLIKATAGSEAVSATNPLYSMTSRMFSYSPIAGAIGEASTTSVTFRNASSSGLTRGTTGSV